MIFDRYISATQIKLTSLNYLTCWLKPFWWNLNLKNTFILNVNVDVSLDTETQRDDEYLYEKEGLAIERELYIGLAQQNDFIIIDNRISIDHTINVILNKLSL